MRIDAVRRWLDDHPEPSHSDLARAGLVAPAWPKPWGLGADADLAAGAVDELERRGVQLPDNQIGIGWAGPTILAAGTPAQIERWIPPLLDGSEFWCQLFSEPNAGSDLASLTVRAVADGDQWIIDGQKIWTTWAERSQVGILLARTDTDVPAHRGISCFICPMDRPGIEVRPLREMSGGHHFCEVFFDAVRLDADHLVGAPGDGWRLARVTLGNERLSLSEGGLCWGMGPTTGDLLELIGSDGVADPVLRQRVAGIFTERFVIERLRESLRGAVDPGADASRKKFLTDVHGQHVTELAADLTGAAAMLAGPDAVGPTRGDPGEWPWAFLFGRALTIGGGTSQVQRSILAEQVLGLPRDQR